MIVVATILPIVIVVILIVIFVVVAFMLIIVVLALVVILPRVALVMILGLPHDSRRACGLADRCAAGRRGRSLRRDRECDTSRDEHDSQHSWHSLLLQDRGAIIAPQR